MTIKELKEQLNKYKNEEVDVYIYFEDEIHEIDFVDLDINDRVDINIKETKN